MAISYWQSLELGKLRREQHFFRRLCMCIVDNLWIFARWLTKEECVCQAALDSASSVLRSVMISQTGNSSKLQASYNESGSFLLKKLSPNHLAEHVFLWNLGLLCFRYVFSTLYIRCVYRHFKAECLYLLCQERVQKARAKAVQAPQWPWMVVFWSLCQCKQLNHTLIQLGLPICESNHMPLLLVPFGLDNFR